MRGDRVLAGYSYHPWWVNGELHFTSEENIEYVVACRLPGWMYPFTCQNGGSVYRIHPVDRPAEAVDVTGAFTARVMAQLPANEREADENL